jgi:hypothetical protein
MSIVTPGGPVATQLSGGDHWQQMKVAVGSPPVEVTGDAANGLDVDVTRVSGTVTVDESTVSTATVSNVNVSTSAVTLKASNGSRKGLIIYNDSTQALRVKYGSGAAAASFTVKLAAQGYWEMPRKIYTGIVTGIWEGADASGAARVTEW